MLLSLFLTVIVDRKETKTYLNKIKQKAKNILTSKTNYVQASQTKEKNVKSTESNFFKKIHLELVLNQYHTK